MAKYLVESLLVSFLSIDLSLLVILIVVCKGSKC